MTIYYADVRQPDGTLQTVEIRADSLNDALSRANEEYGLEAVHGVADSLAFGWKGKPRS